MLKSEIYLWCIFADIFFFPLLPPSILFEDVPWYKDRSTMIPVRGFLLFLLSPELSSLIPCACVRMRLRGRIACAFTQNVHIGVCFAENKLKCLLLFHEVVHFLIFAAGSVFLCTFILLYRKGERDRSKKKKKNKEKGNYQFQKIILQIPLLMLIKNYRSCDILFIIKWVTFCDFFSV